MPNAAEALQVCRACGKSGAFSISEDAHARAKGQGHSPADVMHALAHATRCVPAEGRWTVHGPSLDGTEMAMFVVLAAGTLSVL